MIRITSIGARAARLLDQHADWTVEATFDRSFYLRSGHEFICVGDASIGDGPLNALHADSASQATTQKLVALPSGQRLSWNEALIWQAAPWPPVANRALHADCVGSIIAAAIDAAPATSFVHALTSKLSDDLVARRAREGIDRLSQALDDPTLKTCDAAALSLLGLGHGLTPSGDDVLSGALIMLSALNRTKTATTLAAAIQRHMDTATSPLSCAFLRAACDGEPSAAVHQAIGLLLNGANPSQVVAPARSVGHASGFDMLAGILVAAVVPAP